MLKKKVSRETWNNLYPVGFRQSQDVWVSVQAHVTIVYEMNPQTKRAFHNYRIRLLSRPLEKESITIISSSSSGSSRKTNHIIPIEAIVLSRPLDIGGGRRDGQCRWVLVKVKSSIIIMDLVTRVILVAC